MKKIVVVLCMLFLIKTTVWADEITVNYEGNRVSFDTPPFLENDVTMVPIRAIAEAMKAEVLWSPSEQTVCVKRAEDVITLVVGETQAKKNETEMQLDMAAKIVENRVFVPLRFVGEALGLNVVWDKNTKTIALTEKAQKEKNTLQKENVFYENKGSTYSISLPKETWQEEKSDFENTLILNYVKEKELSILIASHKKEEIQNIESLQDFAALNRESVYKDIYAMGVVIPQEIILPNMKNVKAEEITVKEKEGVSKAFFVYCETENYYYICVLTGTEKLYDLQLSAFKEALQSITEK